MKKRNTVIAIVICLVAALLSATVVANQLSSVEFHRDTIEYLDEKKDTVLALTGAAAAASAVVAAVPGDATTPIAEKIADVTQYLLIVSCALYLEKFLVTTLGVAAFRFLIPAALVLLALYLWFGKENLKKLALKISLLGVTTFMIIPVSVTISKTIEKTFENTIQETIDYAENNEIEEEEKDQNWIQSMIGAVATTTEDAVEYCKTVLGNFVDSVAVLIVTSCLIPIAVILLFVQIMKMILGLELSDIRTGKKVRINA
ncbi:MAG: hypothetical protein ACI32N_05285 [Bulleidia sp.]